ncbi:RES family NAD+ phosphorylase [Dactylosporangium sp. CA-139066]|uniref:RES family NAD+ phosphorylase n=1 Tax=Dactylosporangium sp. CA-139066 TaxID=3239930 RepID=UPI003D9319D4
MPFQPPPKGRVVLRHRTLPAGARLYRVHATRYDPSSFNPKPALSPFGGGRFDATSEDPFSYLYLAEKPATALAEVLLRDLAANERGARRVPYAAVRQRSFTPVTLRAPAEVVTLVSATDLATIGQDGWLVDADARFYPQTRHYAAWLRRRSDAAGIVWQSHRDRPHLAIVLFGDRYKADDLAFDPAETIDLGSPAGVGWVNSQLVDYNAVVGRR